MAGYLDFGDSSVIGTGAVDSFESTAIKSAMIEMDSVMGKNEAECDAAMDSQYAIIEESITSSTAGTEALQ